ncbi:XRE family transcriptional regulator [Rhizobium leguminosarum]|uniref:XRE family transcriptional regulator n=1 Tax=Rhizobium leguminosarum TaxID=384 RepID=UPI002E0E8417|nr:XRE family transcriptional regulator [Rhizobium leguminosarum]
MENAALVELALAAQACSNKELAVRLGVSPSQISKWKKDAYGHMSFEMESKLRELAGIGQRSADFVLTCGTLDNAKKWEEVLQSLAEAAGDEEETGYKTDLFINPSTDLFGDTFAILKRMGVRIPSEFPTELVADAQLEYSDDDDFHGHPIARLISEIYRSYNDVYGFYVAYISELEEDERIDGEEARFIYSGLLEFAASKIDPEPDVAPGFKQFRTKVKAEFSELLSDLKKSAARAGVPLRAELMDMVRMPHEDIGLEAERESLGSNQNRHHPDIYMNELLEGMRMIHQVLPVIIKKLGITADELSNGASVDSEDFENEPSKE